MRVHEHSGFTLIEIITVVIIIGVLAAVLAVRQTGSNERIASSEGMQTLTTLLGAQKRYYLENNAYTTNEAALDVTIVASSYFNAPFALNPGASGNVARVTRSVNKYTLYIDDTGVITCTSGTVTCASIKCDRGAGNQCLQ